ncbi:hypothetical protein ATANTOWER_015252 [Ataeniobius toweri]|uniref:Uncharacterized protein n=1 Tax=Ataeniobius toweri TaxID=208326 RepID=A0ABU7CK63_9TELE|nr:hypothetical protein [Ataeniobius toweri]
MGEKWGVVVVVGDLQGVWARSVQATPSEVVGNDDIGHSVKHNLDVPRICGAGHVTVDFLIWRAVLALELCLDVSCCVLIGVGSCTGGEKKLNLNLILQDFRF